MSCLVLASQCRFILIMMIAFPAACSNYVVLHLFIYLKVARSICICFEKEEVLYIMLELVIDLR